MNSKGEWGMNCIPRASYEEHHGNNYGNKSNRPEQGGNRDSNAQEALLATQATDETNQITTGNKRQLGPCLSDIGNTLATQLSDTDNSSFESQFSQRRVRRRIAKQQEATEGGEQQAPPPCCQKQEGSSNSS